MNVKVYKREVIPPQRNFICAPTSRWASSPSYSRSHLPPKASRGRGSRRGWHSDTHGETTGTMDNADRSWGARKAAAISGLFSSMKSCSQVFLPNQKSYSQHMENRAILPKGGWEGMKLEALASSGALLSPYLFYLISVFFPKCLWLQVPSSLFPLPTTCSGSLSCHT